MTRLRCDLETGSHATVLAIVLMRYELTPSVEVDRAYENLQKSGKGYGMGGRRKFSPMHGPGSARRTPDVGEFQNKETPVR